MTRFAIIDSNSGYVWGVADAADAVTACRIIDRDVAPSDEAGRSYETTSASDAADHYLVYDATALTQAITDGQDDAQISAVSALPLVERVRWYACD